LTARATSTTDAIIHVLCGPTGAGKTTLERWRRVEQRNIEKGSTYQLEISRDIFDFLNGLWEAPSADEFKLLNIHQAT